MGITGRRNPEESLREEIQQEKAAVLGRAGEMLALALAELRSAGEHIDEQVRFLEQLPPDSGSAASDPLLLRRRQCALREANETIDAYNQLWQYAQLRYHYLIVTREAMGLRRHDRVKEIYVIPDKRKHLHADRG